MVATGAALLSQTTLFSHNPRLTRCLASLKMFHSTVKKKKIVCVVKETINEIQRHLPE